MRRRLILVIGLTVGAATVGAGCNPIIITARFPDGSPAATTELANDHVDSDPILVTDQLCANPYTTDWPETFCTYFWTPPKQHEWHQHIHRLYMGIQGLGQWVVMSDDLNEWHMWYEWTYWPASMNTYSDYWAYNYIAGETNFGRGCIYCGEDNNHHPY